MPRHRFRTWPPTVPLLHARVAPGGRQYKGSSYGVRFEIEPNPPAGRGVLIARGKSSAVQVAWAGVPRRDGDSGHSAGVDPPVREA